MAKSPTILTVVAAMLTDGAGRVLMQKRPFGKEHAGLWEFPGGKVEAGELPRNALVRELNEELGITVECGALEPIAFAESAPREGDRAIVILLYKANSWDGTPASGEGAEIGWFTLAETAELPLPPLDVDLVQQLRGVTSHAPR
jgi:8-oxo-dGTP diphosphatase